MLSNNPDRVWNPVRVDKLWYFAHNLQMEQESDLVALGKLTHEEHYTRDTSKDEFIFRGIRLDRITPDGYIHEIKNSDIAEKAHVWQLKYYLWVLKENGFGELQGILEFPKQRKRVPVRLTQEEEPQLLKMIEQITDIIKQPKPPPAKKIVFCKKCSYRELCWC